MRMQWFLDPFDPQFMQRALLASMLAVVASSVVGTWVVLRRLTFLGDALAHGVIPGMALAVLWGFNLTVGALATAALMVGGITLVNRRARLAEDTGVGLLFVGMLALGVIIISKSRSFATDVQGLLFGDVLGITWDDIRLQAVAAVLVLVASAGGYRAFLALSFNETKAASLGLRPGLTHLALLALIAVAIVSSFQAVGTLLVFGLLVGPPATAALLVRHVWLCMVVAVGLGWVAVSLGLILSYQHGTAAGATMAGVSVAMFFAVLAGQELAGAARRTRKVPARNVQ
ncbi:MAG TPA: zinc ABC transporter permease AztB [Acidimicrobiales bacterium]|nr:zinc ABC transporter permease AztB [Acidimicrobiales bacterium]